MPATWTPPQGDELRFSVSPGTNEYTDIQKTFDATMAGHYQKIIMIERIQNKPWYMQYAIHRDAFREKLNADTEKRLFHGCSEDSANKIIKSWFNPLPPEKHWATVHRFKQQQQVIRLLYTLSE